MFEERFRQNILPQKNFIYLPKQDLFLCLLRLTLSIYHPEFFKKIFPFELIKNDISLGDISKQVVHIFMKHDPKNASMP